MMRFLILALLIGSSVAAFAEESCYVVVQPNDKLHFLTSKLRLCITPNGDKADIKMYQVDGKELPIESAVKVDGHGYKVTDYSNAKIPNSFKKYYNKPLDKGQLVAAQVVFNESELDMQAKTDVACAYAQKELKKSYAKNQYNCGYVRIGNNPYYYRKKSNDVASIKAANVDDGNQGDKGYVDSSGGEEQPPNRHRHGKHGSKKSQKHTD